MATDPDHQHRVLVELTAAATAAGRIHDAARRADLIEQAVEVTAGTTYLDDRCEQLAELAAGAYEAGDHARARALLTTATELARSLTPLRRTDQRARGGGDRGDPDTQ